MTLEPIPSRVPDLGPAGMPEAVAGVAWRPPAIEDAPAIREAMNLAGVVDHPDFQIPLHEVEDRFRASYVDPQRDLVVGERDGAIVAWGATMLPSGQETVRRVLLGGGVVPEARRQGIGSTLLDWEERRAAELLREHDEPLPAQIHAWAGSETSFVPVASARGYGVARWFIDLHRDLAAPIAQLDAGGLDVVPFSIERSEQVRVARDDAFRDHWGSQPTTPERWERFVGGASLRGDLSALAVEGDRVVGFALVAHDPEDTAVAGYSSAYVELVGVVRDRRGRGIAPRLLTRVLELARDAGLERAVLDVDADSPTGAVGLYERIGFAAERRTVVLERAW